MIFFIIIYLVSAFSVVETDTTKSQTPVALHLETVIEDSEEAILGKFGGATITNSGDILYSDRDQKTVLVFNAQGDYLTKFGREGRGPGEFEIPRVIASDHEGFIYVSDLGNARISVWNSDYTYRSDIFYQPGSGTQFFKNKNDLFIFTKPFVPLQNGYDAAIIYKIDRDKRELSQFFVYEIRDWFDEHRFFNSTSNVAITDEDLIIATGKLDKHQLRLIDLTGKALKEFGKKSEPVYYTEEEMQRRIDYAASIDPYFAEIVSQGRKYKHIYSDIEISDRNRLWVHRNKKFGARDEIDIYNLDGEYKTMVTIPPSPDELQMLGIYGNKVLFHVTTPTAEEKLHVYKIEYSMD
jgi:hypothetical protein